MNKKLLTLLCLSSISGVALADISLYGRMSVGVENDSFGSGIASAGSVQSFGSYFGLHGSESLSMAGDTRVIWQIENNLDIASGTTYFNQTGGGQIGANGLASGGMYRVTSEVNTLASSETYLGASGTWGSFKAGNLSNYVRSNMGGFTDVYNCGNGVDCLGNWSRLALVLPDSVSYATPSWHGFSAGVLYSFNNSGQISTSGIGIASNPSNGLAGYYNGGITSIGVGYAKNNFGINWMGQIWQDVGAYPNGNGNVSPVIYGDGSSTTGYASRIELGYSDPTGLLIGTGIQVTQGLGLASWANSGGTYGVSTNNITDPNILKGLQNSSYQTQEMAFTLGYHIGDFMPKASYAFGSNWMTGGTLWDMMTAQGNQIGGTSYQQFVTEIDWIATKSTVVFANVARIWYGDTLQNIQYNGASAAGNASAAYNTSTPGAFYNQMTIATGVSHTF